MNILVLGASQGTGALVVKQALARGLSVTAFSRNPGKIGVEHPNLRLQPGDFHDAASVDAAVAGHDAVIVTVSVSRLSDFRENPNYFSGGTAHVIASMRKHGVRRLVILSALGAGDSRDTQNFLVKWLVIDGLLRAPMADHGRQEALVKASDLDWVIVRPSKLHDRRASGRAVRQTGTGAVPPAVSRADVAELLVDAATQPQWVRQQVAIGG